MDKLSVQLFLLLGRQRLDQFLGNGQHLRSGFGRRGSCDNLLCVRQEWRRGGANSFRRDRSGYLIGPITTGDPEIRQSFLRPADIASLR